MFNTRQLGTAWLVVLLLPACQDGNQGSGPIPLSEIKARAADAVCAFGVRCGGYPDVDTCKAAVTTTDQIVAGVNAGRIRYDGNAAAVCLATFAGMGCNRTDRLPDGRPACSSTFQGTLLGGASCFVDEDCVSAICSRSSCVQGQSCCPGTCNPPPAIANPIPVGGACSSSTAICEEGAYCDYGSASPTCTKGAALGEGCNPSAGVSSGCLNSTLCLPGSSAMGGTCSLPPAEGQPCNTLTTSCNSSNDYCDVASGKCARRIAVGIPCPQGAGCVDYAICDPNTLTCVSKGRAGETCSNSPGPGCMGSLQCNGTCVLPSPKPVCP